MNVNDQSALKTVFVLLAILSCRFSLVFAQEKSNQPTDSNAQSSTQKVFKVDPSSESQQLVDHPLQEALQIAHQVADRIGREINDYTCDLVMRERIRGRLSNIYLAKMKLRCGGDLNAPSGEPFSVYLHFVAPAKVKGREVLYIENQNDGKMIARNGGESNLKDVTILMKPDSKRAMRGRHYPVTEVGIANIVKRLIEEAKHSMQIDRERRECEVRIIENAKIEGRPCRCIQVVFPQKRENLKFHLVRIFLDNETDFPLRYSAYSWPLEKGGPPRLIEEYTFLNFRMNVGLSDIDFDRENPDYDFYSSGEDASVAEINLQSAPGN